MIRLESGVRVRDGRSGSRVYPLGLVRAVPCRANGPEFEEEIITRAGWAGCEIAEVFLSNTAKPAMKWATGVRLAVTHIRLLMRTLVPWPHPRWPEKAVQTGVLTRGLWRELLRWLSPRQVWRHLRDDQVAKSDMALGLSIGVFIANLPCYGVQGLLALYVARRLHLHPLGVLLGTQISTPPIGVAMVAGALCVGHLVLHGSWIPISPDQLAMADLKGLVPSLLLDWAVGSVILGVAMACVTYPAAMLLLKMIRPAKDRRINNCPK